MSARTASVLLAAATIIAIPEHSRSAHQCIELRATADWIDLFVNFNDLASKQRVSKDRIGKICKLGIEDGFYHVRLERGTWWAPARQVWDTEMNPLVIPPTSPVPPNRGGPSADTAPAPAMMPYAEASAAMASSAATSPSVYASSTPPKHRHTLPKGTDVASQLNREELARLQSGTFAYSLTPPIAAAGASTAPRPSAQAGDERQTDQVQAARAHAARSQIAKMYEERKWVLAGDVLFPEGGDQLSANGKQALDQYIPQLQNLQNAKVVVYGYTDNKPVGPALQRLGIANNVDLSSRRAENVVAYLTSHGVNPNIVTAKGFGDTHPVVANDTPQGRAQNRRIEIVLEGLGG